MCYKVSKKSKIDYSRYKRTLGGLSLPAKPEQNGDLKNELELRFLILPPILVVFTDL